MSDTNLPPAEPTAPAPPASPSVAGAGRAIACPSCGGSIEIKAAGLTVSVGCPYCGSLLDVAHPDVSVIAAYDGIMAQLAIPLGKRGTLFGGEWEVIGALVRSDGDVEWSEFLLFNPYAGYRWLVLSEGEWQFGTPLLDRPVPVGSGAVQWFGQRLDQDYEPAATTTNQVVGEFYWRVKAGDTVQATTYSRANDSLSAEFSEDEVNWTHLVPVSAREVTQAFGLGTSSAGGERPVFGRKSGQTLSDDAIKSMYLNGVTSSFGDLPKMFWMAAGTIFASLVVMIMFNAGSASISQSATIAIDGPEISQTIGTITIDRAYQPVRVNLNAGSFDNRWIDVDARLVDRATQRSIDANGVVERYSGRDSDGDWSEGSNSNSVSFSSVPRGTYDIVVDLSAHTWNGSSSSGFSAPDKPTGIASWGGGETIPVQMTATVGGILWGNLILEMFILLGLPVLLMFWRNRNTSEDDE
jgi:hypothetical protein